MSPGWIVVPPHATVTSASHGTCLRPSTAGWFPADHTGMPTAATASASRTAAVRDDPGGAARVGPQRQHVAERRGTGLAARLDDEHLAGGDGVERALLRVVAAAVPLEQVLAVGHEPQGPGRADELRARVHRPDAVDRDVVQPALAQLRRQARDRAPAAACRAGRPRARVPRPAASGDPHASARWWSSTDGQRPERRRRTATSPCVTVVTRRPVVGPPADVDLDLDDVAGDDDARPGGRAGEDDVARLERQVLREVGDDLREREEQAGRRVVLRQPAVHPGADAQRRGVDRPRVEERRTDRREAVAALGAQVGALVVGAQVVEAEVVGRGDPADVAPRRPPDRRGARSCR